MSLEQFDLAIERRGGEDAEEIWRSEIAVVLRDLVLEDEVIAPRVPGELRNEAVILMPIVAVVSEDEVGREVALQRLELVFHGRARERKKSSPVAAAVPSTRTRRMSVEETLLLCPCIAAYSGLAREPPFLGSVVANRSRLVNRLAPRCNARRERTTN